MIFINLFCIGTLLLRPDTKYPHIIDSCLRGIQWRHIASEDHCHFQISALPWFYTDSRQPAALWWGDSWLAGRSTFWMTYRLHGASMPHCSLSTCCVLYPKHLCFYTTYEEWRHQFYSESVGVKRCNEKWSFPESLIFANDRFFSKKVSCLLLLLSMKREAGRRLTPNLEHSQSNIVNPTGWFISSSW